MKRLSKVLIAVLLALIISAALPAQVFADSLPEYISEIKIFEGSYDTAASEGYKILNGDDGKPVDLNQSSGKTGVAANGNKKVYLGYKTTTNRDEAITDLALMNMKGGYSVQEYEALMAEQMKSQIVPFVDSFLDAIIEYRENYKSSNTENKKRAEFIHDVLNKFTDDDCSGAGLGDLLLKETVYEIAKPKYDALSAEQKKNTSVFSVNEQVKDSLSESEKNNHADILTIVSQSNGKILLVLENLLARAADTNDDTWLERFENTTYEDLVEETGLPPTDAFSELSQMYDDTASVILDKWDEFRDELLDYDKNVETAENFDVDKAIETEKAAEKLDNNTDQDKAVDVIMDLADQKLADADVINSIQSASIHDILADIDYLDDSMLDFFLMTKEEAEQDITKIYPLVYSLSQGQTAGLEFLSLKDLFAVALTTSEGYDSIDISKIEKVSVYDGVDRAIYEKGGVALTSNALRTDAVNKMMQESDDSMFSNSTIAMMVVSGALAAGAFLSFVSWGGMKLDVYFLEKIAGYLSPSSGVSSKTCAMLLRTQPGLVKAMRAAYGADRNSVGDAIDTYVEEYAERMTSRASIAGKLAIGFTVAAVILAAVTTYLSYKEMKAYYKIDFTPIPHYMVEESDIVITSANNEKVVLNKQGVYYKAVESNRKPGDKFYDVIGSLADMNGCVNPQWLALYAQKNELGKPILASSLKVVVGSSDKPAGYTAGIHLFGEDNAFNLNYEKFCFNENAKSVQVYYKLDETSSGAGTAGSGFTAGSLAIVGAVGLAAGALISGLAVSASNRKKKDSAKG